MALTRCTCLVSWRTDVTGRPCVDVHVLDPDCSYVVHRAVAEVLDLTG